MTDYAINDSLPDGWRWARLGDVCEKPQYGYTAPSTQQNTGTKYLRITDIQDARVEWDRVPYCEIQSSERRQYLLREGDVVFARTGATTGKSFLIGEVANAVFASYLIRVRPFVQELLPDFLYLFLQSPDYWTQVESAKRGGIQPNMNATLLSDVVLPLPPLSEQRRIATILTEEMAAVDKARNSVQAQLDAAKKLPAAYLRAVFESEDAEQWQAVELPKVAFFQEGPGVRTSQFRSNGVKLLNVTNIVDGRLNLSNTIRFLDESEAYGRYKHFFLEDGDIVLASSGASWGKVAIATQQDLPVVMNTSTIRLHPLDNKVLDRDFLRYFMESRKFKDQIARMITGAAQPNFGPVHLKQVELPLPPVSIQQSLASSLNDQIGAVKKIVESLEAGLAETNKLTVALLRRAFNGEL